ncbi:hypothetical protein EMCRGX_G015796 [Ephydatia muelleri]
MANKSKLPRLPLRIEPKPPVPVPVVMGSSPNDSPTNNSATAELEEMKRRMGLLTFHDKAYELTFTELDEMKKIGNGICGEVYRCRHKKSDTVIAAKKMVWVDNQEERKRILMDLKVMTTHRCPYIVQYYGSVLKNGEVWVFMELMETCLDRLLKALRTPIPEEVVCTMTVSIVKALNYLKTEHSVIHRDVKPSNMLLDRRGNVKLCDFGISGRLVDSQAFTRNAGCAGYMAPERIKLSSNQGYDEFGTEFELLTFIVDAPPPLPDSSKFSPEFCDFLSKCLAKNVEERLHYSELLEHSLIKMYEKTPVDMCRWYSDVCARMGQA